MSCLFQAFSHFVPDDSPDLIRQKVCNFLALNRRLGNRDARTYVVWLSGEDLDAYVANMRRESTWGGAIEIQAFCELYDVHVTSIDLRTGDTMEYQPSGSSQGLRITITWNGGHYEPQRGH